MTQILERHGFTVENWVAGVPTSWMATWGSGHPVIALGTAYAGTKWAVRGISQCWQAELRPFGIKVICVCPSEVQTNWGGRTGRNNPNKLYAEDIAETVMAALSMRTRALWPELAVFATNPWKEH